MITYKKEKISVDTYLYLRSQVKWKALSRVQAQTALDNSLVIFVAYDGDKPVGMGRIVGDGAVISYIQDLIVIPGVQGRGIGSGLIKRLIDFVESIRIEGTEMMLCLMCAKGREGFYAKHGFIARPNDALGPGMIQYLKY